MCIFCKIVNGEIPCSKVYEDEKILAFLDIKPLNPGHTLVIVKNHYANIEETPAEEFLALASAAKKLGQLLKDKLGIEGYNLSMNNDPAAGQDIAHIHFHLIPRHRGDGFAPWARPEASVDENKNVLEKLLS